MKKRNWIQEIIDVIIIMSVYVMIALFTGLQGFLVIVALIIVVKMFRKIIQNNKDKGNF